MFLFLVVLFYDVLCQCQGCFLVDELNRLYNCSIQFWIQQKPTVTNAAGRFAGSQEDGRGPLFCI